MLTYHIKEVPSGKQLIIEREDGTALLEAIIDYCLKHNDSEGYKRDNCFLEVMESLLCNGLSTALPEDIGALTSSIILTEHPPVDHGEKYPDDADFFWFGDYQLYSPLEDLLLEGQVIFTNY